MKKLILVIKIKDITIKYNSMNHILFSQKEKDEIFESAGLLIDSLITQEPMKFIQPDFHETLITDVTNLLISQICNIYILTSSSSGSVGTIQDNQTESTNQCLSDNTNEYSDKIHNIVSKATDTYYKHVYPPRSYSKTFIRIKPNIETTSNHLQYLRDIPQPEQRTPEWYSFRHNYITASSAWKAFLSPTTQNQLIYDKCIPHDPNKYSSCVNINSPLQWGVRYEPVSIFWYENYYSTIIEDFGCIPHPTLSCLAASPDGINIDSNSDRFGRMLEVKNIVNRNINGIPKLEYWIQMQLQMEVCNLNECDFLETRFKEYETYDDFISDGTFQKTASGKNKGIIMYFNNNGIPLYEYSPWNATKEEYEKWESIISHKNSHLTWISNSYWFLDEVSCILVLRNKLWFTTAKPILENLWKTVCHERINGYQHRAPRRKTKIIKNSTQNTGCIINTKTLISSTNDSPTTNNIQEDNTLIETNTISINTETLTKCALSLDKLTLTTVPDENNTV